MVRLFSPSLLRGDDTRARVVRGSLLIGIFFGGNKFLRLFSNLILTRLLFPEAFGMMALVGVFTTALEMFSDTGIKSSIIQSKRGHDPIYLNTAWTVQIFRGILLWLAALVVAGPAARFYGEPMLADLLPVAALSIVILGFTSTKEATANKNILLGRLTVITLGCQILGIAINVALALWLQSVWALVFGAIVGNLVRVILTHWVLPGENNRLAWDREVFWDLFHFGKYILIGTAAGFLVRQGDRAILGKFVSLSELAVYNIGWMLAAAPLSFSRMFGRRMLFPLYARFRPGESEENRQKVARLRYLLTGAMLSVSLGLGLFGDWLVRMLYLPAYHLAGPVLVLVAIAGMPIIIAAAYNDLLLGSGNSRSFTIILIATALIQTTALFFGIQAYGLLGAIVAPPLATILVYPLSVFMVRPYGAWDLRHDGISALVVCLAWALVLSVHSDTIARLLPGTS